MTATTMKSVSFEEANDLIESAEVLSCLDLGHSFVYEISHPEMGHLFVLSSSVGDGCYIQL
jgi:hypothetical protein